MMVQYEVMRGLLVVDEVVLRRVLARALRVRMAIDEASRLAEARELLRVNPYDVLLTEDRLPDGGGCALLASDQAQRCRRALISVVGPGELEDDVYERSFVMPADLTALVLWIDGMRAQAASSAAAFHPHARSGRVAAGVAPLVGPDDPSS